MAGGNLAKGQDTINWYKQLIFLIY